MDTTLQFKFVRERDGRVHCLARHGVPPEVFLNPIQEGPAKENRFDRIGRTQYNEILMIIFIWIEVDKKVLIITAYNWYEEMEVPQWH
jgi:hypothetical protein